MNQTLPNLFKTLKLVIIILYIEKEKPSIFETLTLISWILNPRAIV